MCGKQGNRIVDISDETIEVKIVLPPTPKVFNF